MQAMRRNPFSSGLMLAFAGILVTVTAMAHHGWGWAEDELVEISGRITDVRLGNPHGEVDMQTADGEWTAEVGQPWRNERAGLTEELLTEGAMITVIGNRSANEEERLIKAVRVVIDGHNHDLYPGRVP
ncbi:MAG: hypothetical protein JJU06_17545 [Ectothiorhodospiraceae bacterium]|nr:hypothetical protein [Ectothiorhodospiraceae bacterium]MCH8502710.1 hypothetical protein [Ectothiorhodospiraceae bacterium]